MGTTTKLITYEDSLTMSENRFEEIVHGESRIMPPPSKKHADLIAKLITVLLRQLDDSEYQVLSQGAGLGIERVPLTYRVPDLMVFRTEARRCDREAASNDPYIWTPPDLLVECLSPSNRKGAVSELLADYERIAVPEVWLLDPAPPQFTSYLSDAGKLRNWATRNDGIVTPLLLPSVTIHLAELWTAFAGII